MSIEEGLLTAKDVAAMKRIAVSTVWKAARDARLPSIRILGRVAFRKADVDAWEPYTHGGARPNTGHRLRNDVEID